MVEKNRIFENIETRVQCRIIDRFLSSGPLTSYPEVSFKEISDNIPDGKSPIMKMPELKFLQKYRPISLYVGDEVVKVCMGKILKIFKVSKVENLRATYENSSLETSTIIFPNLSIRVFIKDDVLNYPCEYKFLSEAMKQNMENGRINCELIRNLKDIIDVVYSSDESVNFSGCLYDAEILKNHINVIAHNGE